MKRILFFLFVAVTAIGQDTLKFSGFTPETSPAGTDYLAGYRSAGVAGGNRRFSLSVISTYINAQARSIATVTGLQAALDGKADDADLSGKMDPANFAAGSYPFPATIASRVNVLYGTLAEIDAITLAAGELAVITDQAQGRLIRIGDGTTAGGLPFAALEKALNLSNKALFPIMVYAKSLTVLTAGTPADIGSIVLPPGITRYASVMTSSVAAGGMKVVAETAAGTLSGASFTARDGATGGGNALTAAVTGPASAMSANGGAGANAVTIFTSQTLYINPTANSANAGTCSFYVWIVPLP